MNDYISREAALKELLDWCVITGYGGLTKTDVIRAMENVPAADVVEVVRCRDCVHAPVVDGQYKDGFDVKFPDEICPCQCEDGWYNHIPDPDWFCADGERKDGADNETN